MQAVKIYNLREVDELIVLDISATNNNKKIDLELINEIANETFMPLTVGGGVKSIEDVSNLLKLEQIKCLLILLLLKMKIDERVLKTFGSQCIVAQ